jgi:hypothetical protein
MTLKNLKSVQKTQNYHKTKKNFSLAQICFFRQFEDEKKIP